MKFNRKYASLNANGTLSYAPVPLVLDGVNYWTNITDKYGQAGFYPIENTEMPTRDGFYYTSRYEQREGKIVQVWDEHEIPIPEPEPEEPDPEAQLEELEAMLNG